jgi:putative oxidoreductase
LEQATSLVIPQLGPVYQALAEWAELLLRVVVGLALLPHGLRSCFGFFPGTGVPIRNLGMLAEDLTRRGYPPGWLWAVGVMLTNTLGGLMLAAGFLTRPAALPIFVLLSLSAFEHARRDGYFWNRQGFEYPALWAVGALYFLVHGGGPLSIDRLLGWEF